MTAFILLNSVFARGLVIETYMFSTCSLVWKSSWELLVSLLLSWYFAMVSFFSRMFYWCDVPAPQGVGRAFLNVFAQDTWNCYSSKISPAYSYILWVQSFVINSHSFYFSSLSLTPVMVIFLFSILVVLTLLPNLVWSFWWWMSMLVDAECLYMLHNLLIRFELLHGIQLPKNNCASNGIC